MSNLTLKSNLAYTEPQGMEANYQTIQNENVQQQKLIDATEMKSGGGRRRRRQRGGLPTYPNATPHGYVEVEPLPQGSQTANTQQNNIQNAATFADATQAAEGDKYASSGSPVYQKGGRTRRRRRVRRARRTRRTRRLVKKKKKTRGKKVKLSRKKRGRRTRRR